jgi:IS5 family transposase
MPAAWVYDAYFQHFTGEEFFQHEFPHERSDLSHWRKRYKESSARGLAADPRPLVELKASSRLYSVDLRV